MKFYQSSKWIQVGIIAAVTAISAPQVFAQDAGTRVAVVNSEKVFNESNLAKAMQTRLQNEFTKRQNDLRDSAQKIKSAAEKLDRDAAVMNESERIRRQREFTEDLNQRTFEERAKIAEKANAVLKQIAEQRKIDVIVQEAAYVSPKADVTDDVIKALNSLK